MGHEQYDTMRELGRQEAPGATPACVSVIMPFNPKMIAHSRIEMALGHALEEVERQLSPDRYGRAVTRDILSRLRRILDGLDYTTHKESIAIYISPTVEKVYYLAIPVMESIVVDTSFKIRNLVLNKQDNHEFLLLVISSRKEKIFVGSRDHLTQIILNRSVLVQRDLPERVGNFTDAKTQRETTLHNFLRYIDNGLDLILKIYPLPLFVMTTKKTMGLFRQITRHGRFVSGYIHGDFENATESELLQGVRPQVENWKIVKENDVRNRLGVAQNDLKLVTGVENVLSHASRKLGRLLVVEKDFNYPAVQDPADDTPRRDMVDDIIEKVLESGGDVEFVDDIKDYNHIALIEYYHTT